MSKIKGYKTIKAGLFLIKHPFIFYILLYTWGIFYTAIGWLISIIMLISFHKPHIYKNRFYFRLRINGGFGFELGSCFLVSKDLDIIEDNEVFNHELGHIYQNAIFGPFMIFLVLFGIIRYWYFILTKSNKDYYDIWLENSATIIGSLVLK